MHHMWVFLPIVGGWSVPAWPPYGNGGFWYEAWWTDAYD